MQSAKLVFFGNERLATGTDTKAPVLTNLIRKGYQITAVVSNYTQGISRNPKRLEIIDIAHAYHIPVYLPENPMDIKEDLKVIDADLAVLVAYGKIIPQAILDIFPKGIVNIHPSLLPKYRGPTPVETAILDGVKKTGVSLMKLSPEMDTGPLFIQKTVKLSGGESKQELADRLLQLGSSLLIKYLPAILDGSLKPEKQENSQATYTHLLNKSDGLIDWQQPAEQIERLVRAFQNFPKALSKIEKIDVIITKVRVAKDEADGSLIMRANPGWIEILELVAPSGKTITGGEFLRGYSHR
jgi:methionyl-tRNA formyltransferase